MDILLAIKTIVILTVGWFVTKVTQEKLNNPDKSLLMVVVNVALGPLRYFNLFMFKEGVPTMEKDMKRVSAKTGLTDYGDLQFVQVRVLLLRYVCMDMYI